MKTHLFPNYFVCFIPMFFCFPNLTSVPRSPTQRGDGDLKELKIQLEKLKIETEKLKYDYIKKLMENEKWEK